MMKQIFTRLPLLALIGLTACATTPSVEATDIPVPRIKPAKVEQGITAAHKVRFAAWKDDFIRRAIAKGYDAGMVKRVIGPAVINERALDRDKTQPEFTKPIWSYVDNAVNASRVKQGKTKLSTQSTMYDRVEARYPVDRHILTAIWGLESAYGKIQGNHDIVSALSSFAFEGRRTEFGERELFGILDAIKAGYVQESQLKGSWAGAMGMVQFIPTTFRDYAVDMTGDGNRDIWTSSADAVGSAAHYLSRHGWVFGQPSAAEVSLPKGFDYVLSDGRKKSVNDWTALGVRPTNGSRWSPQAGFLEARLLVPAGHKGPKFLAFKNFDVIMKYNKSTSYALGISALGEALAGRKLMQNDWPRTDKPLSLTQKKAMQTRLTALGFNTGGVDGLIGPMTRKAIRGWQTQQGLVADGYMTGALYQRLMR